MFRPTPFLELVKTGGAPDRYAIRKDRFVVGSDREADIVINHPSVSRQQVVLEQSESGWTAVAVGHTPVSLNGLPLNSRIIHTGDELDIDGLVLLVFRDPIEEKARERAEKAARGAKGIETGTQDKPRRSRYLLPGVILSVMLTLLLVLAASRRDTGLPDIRQNTPATVAAVLDGGPLTGRGNAMPLAQCIARAADGISVSARVRVGETPFWSLAQSYSGAEAIPALREDAAYQMLRRKVEQMLWDGRKGEGDARANFASEAYEAVIRLVPDATCSAHLLASARLNVLGQSR